MAVDPPIVVENPYDEYRSNITIPIHSEVANGVNPENIYNPHKIAANQMDSSTCAPEQLDSEPASDSSSQSELQGRAKITFPELALAIDTSAFVVGRNVELHEYLHQRDAGLRAHASLIQDENHHVSPDDEDLESEKFQLQWARNGGLFCEGPKRRIHLPVVDSELFMPVHPPPDDQGRYNLGTISRKHLRFYIKDFHVDGEDYREWRLTILGRNGAIVNGQFLAQDDDIELSEYSEITISSLEIKFEFHHKEPEESEDDRSTMSSLDSPASNEVEDSKKKQKQHGDEISKESTGRKPKMNPEDLLDPGEAMPVRRGPGRPPANGKMSKREMKERMKAKSLAGQATVKGSGVNGGEAISQSLTNGESTKEKKANKKRKRTDSNAVGKNVDAEEDGGDAQEEPSSPKPPSPKIEDFTEAQLEQPKHLTYQQMLYTLLKEEDPKALTLQEIYEGIKRNHPYFRFKVPSNGWESSIRHTVVASCFRKVEKNGKGWKYAINHDVPAPQTKPKAQATVSHPQNYRPQYPPMGPGQQPGLPYYGTNGSIPRNGMYIPAYPIPYGAHGQNTLNGQRTIPPRPPIPNQYGQGNNTQNHHSNHQYPHSSTIRPLPTSLKPPNQPAGQSHSQLQTPTNNRMANSSLNQAQSSNGQIPRPVSATNGNSIGPSSKTPQSESQLPVRPSHSNADNVPNSQPSRINGTSSPAVPTTSLQQPQSAPKPENTAPTRASPSTLHHVPGSTTQRPEATSSASSQVHPSLNNIDTTQTSSPTPIPSTSNGKARAVASTPIPPSQIDLFLAGITPPIFERYRKFLKEPSDQSECDRAIAWMMKERKKLETTLRDKKDDSDFLELKEQSPKANELAKQLRHMLRTKDAELLGKR